MTSPYLTNADAAAFLGISVDTLNRWRRAGDFTEGIHFRVMGAARTGKGRRTFRWFPAALRDWVERSAAKHDTGDTVPLAQPSGRRVA